MPALSPRGRGGSVRARRCSDPEPRRTGGHGRAKKVAQDQSRLVDRAPDPASPPRMRFDDPEVRAAYVAGVEEALEGAMLRLPAPELTALRQWRRDLRGWTRGAPPPSPLRWR